MRISEFIPIGRNNSTPMKTLSKRLNKDPRTLRALVQREREKGEPICSNWEQGGYYMPANEFEARIYYRQQRSRIKSAIAALNGVKKYLKGKGDNGQ
ncbi:MAG: hypothetical protein HDT43_04820 [Ruminococcaceae bacterium]|nr:hypothetical protein [Oscillospiraceae bacterium]